MSQGTRPRGRRVLLIVSGGIAAYKTPELVRAFVAAGCEVQVVMTPAAAAFVSELSLATVSTRPVRKRLLDPEEEGHVGHIELADWPDLVVVAPATADLLARATAGMADDLAATVLLATRAPVLWAPAMNTNMWRHPATQANLATLRTRGAEFVGPDRGQLACGWIGEGRMIDPPLIVAAALAQLEARGPWAGKRVLVSAGPTRTYIDPVRFVTNASTGAMGFALAEAARRAGAEVTLVAGPVELATPQGVRRVDVETAEQMFAALESELSQKPYDWVAMVAAVQDLEIDGGAGRKLEKAELLTKLPTLAWRTARDILAALTARFGRGAPAGAARARFLGFAAQTVEDGPEDRLQQELIRLGEAKLRAKDADAIFVNRVGAPGVGFASATNAGLLLARDGDAIAVRASGPPIAKAALATWLLDALAAT
ncbi:bifunctional phosphopantothenoylcysteine decarboxylase/phosphopantothenate--cysteine ligase CoaBC [Nannocystis sp. ILAH1]|uniref:bifunctional phosphopantothenoylcysteine decarboxylase/phosphopantothenate--cysteine ligase CoaBC n=1 Tax=unclassified Nannocystis TaxID=2627009 RepID=UPI00226F0844|nr:MULTISPECIES: bifunctional phosphopantothenoylcysteine decarboxylase/phosphopantothenate--cysteine ligase CoaBC [unclassified Nannocystis]MCY0990217.1 bifunctional phosphopantothenoylcysteine decarboxylase/phosphopantothenate--cysteine ligase CoaBC [Nannocystis sp. ILAH1]MCY1069494.1 bifunctional phosphopantothenoylcysteine decarboxylase/phosphopantothenate--cysteine ligase CoaBC [Nannocystis sp. RBIL2]